MKVTHTLVSWIMHSRFQRDVSKRSVSAFSCFLAKSNWKGVPSKKVRSLDGFLTIFWGNFSPWDQGRGLCMWWTSCDLPYGWWISLWMGWSILAGAASCVITPSGGWGEEIHELLDVDLGGLYWNEVGLGTTNIYSKIRTTNRPIEKSHGRWWLKVMRNEQQAWSI